MLTADDMPDDVFADREAFSDACRVSYDHARLMTYGTIRQAADDLFSLLMAGPWLYLELLRQAHETARRLH
jgi:hypothetical protein